uniref:Integrase catalytic domain-containing protein n=1 Tax=Tanacetum cinerariifolium TaxID=118510 RepID=A0A6L2JY61_TANCI|nr:hypothetical protein [Tanacetum cinerariifolium]
MAGSDNDSDNASIHNEAQNHNQQPNIQPQIITTVSNNNAKFPYLKKDEYEVWAMKMEYWITDNDMNIWKVIQNGNNMKRTGRDHDGSVVILPSTTTKEHISVHRESKARTTLLQSILDDHVANFHYLDDARDIWNVVKSRIGGNAESKKMRKSMLKKEFLEFRIPLTLKTKGGLEFLSFDDLYYNLKTLEVDVKGYNTFSSSQSAGPSHSAFVSATSTNKKISYGDSPNHSSTTTYFVPLNSKTGSHRSGNVIKDVLQLFVADIEPEQQLAYKDLKQIKKLDLEEKDLKWKMAMLFVRAHKFEQKADRKINFDKKESARAKGGNNKQRYSSFKIKEIGKKEEDPKAMITVDTLVDWTNHDSKSDGVIAAKEFGMIAGCDSEDIIKEGAVKLYNLITGGNSEAANTTSDTSEFALMGVTSEWHTSLSDHTDLDESQMSYGTKSSTSCDPKCVPNEFVSCNDSDKSFEVNTNDLASSDSSLKYSEHKPTDSSYASTSSVSTSANEAEIESNVGTSIKEPISVQDLSSFTCNSSNKNEHTSRTSCNKNGSFNKKAGHFRKYASSVSKPQPVPTGKPKVKPVPTGKPKVTPVPTGKPKVTPVPIGKPKVKPVPTGKPKVTPVPTGKPHVFTPVPTGRPNRPFPVPIDKGCSPSELQQFNLFSISHICDKKNQVLFIDTECFVLSKYFKLSDDSMVVLKVPRKHNLYTINLNDLCPRGNLACLVAHASFDESVKWHRQMAHVNYKNMNRLVKGNLVRGLPPKLFKNGHTCVACCEEHKDETYPILKNFINLVENQLNKKVKAIRCDNGIDFKNAHMIELCGSKWIKREYSNPRTPQQNEVAEKKNKTLIEAAITMLADSKLPTMFWTEAVRTDCYVVNRVSVTSPHNKTPYALLTGNIPSVGHFKPFGCHVTILNTSDHLGKFDGKANEGYIVGYSASNKAYRVYNVPNKRVEELMNLWFLEEKPNGTQPIDTLGDKVDDSSLPFADEIFQKELARLKGKEQRDTSYADSPALGTANNADDLQAPPSANPVPPGCIPVPTGSSTDSMFDGEPTIRFPCPSDLGNRNPSPGIFSSSSYDDEFNTALNNVASSVEVSPVATKRINTIHPQSLIIGDLTSTVQMRSKVLVDLPAGKYAIGTKWILKNKGHQTVFSLCLLYGISGMDVKSAFLYGRIDKEIYVTQPKGFMDPQHPKKVYKVVKALYRLHQAPRAWPDIMFAVSACSRHQVTPTTSNLEAVKKIFKYLKGQPKLGLWYPKESPLVLEASSDSNYAGANKDRKSTTGGSEYVAAANCCAQFWSTATLRTAELDPPAILATIDKTPYTITKELVRSRLQLADDGGIADLPILEIYSGMDNLGYVTKGKLTFFKNKFSPQWRGTLCHFYLLCFFKLKQVLVQRPQTSDPVAPVLKHNHSSNPHETAAGSFPTREDAPLGGGFHTSPLRSFQAPYAGQPSGGEEDPITLTTLSSVVSTLIQKVNSLEAELHDHKRLFKDVVGKLVKKVKTLEVKVKTKKRKMVVTMAVDSDLPSGSTLQIPAASPCAPTATSSIPPGASNAPTGASTILLGASNVSTAASDVPADSLTVPADSLNVPAGISSKGKSPMVEEDIPVKARTFRAQVEANAFLSKTLLGHVLEEPSTKRPKSPEAPTPSMPEVPISPTVTSPPSSRTRRKSLGRKHIHKPKYPLLKLDFDAHAQTFLKVVVDEDLDDEDSVDEVWSAVVGWEVLPTPLGEINALYHIDGSTKHFATLRQILHMVDRQDLMKLYGLVVQYYKHHPAAGAGLLFWAEQLIQFIKNQLVAAQASSV